ncbi:aspartate/methionine/tyrosine aminotransferase [Herbihabitans rhizosphaerae]|uniref:Aminotransferase n=2 Tax=Herbihabitans rhizosphaerae TaxID=1872711 RepID=A0A4Q7KEA5_9PSEU|nr:aspartate/methionine/tyrosine aminotransferase [Herbihabitans rhizosphaerae]
MPSLRAAYAAEINRDYGGAVTPDNVVITAGCNQAFCLTISALAEPGSEVIVPLPYYFNHDMWLKLNGITPVYLEPDENLVPRAEAIEALVTDRTRAVVLVTPGNPTGITVPPEEIRLFAMAARKRGIALVLDETYRSFRDVDDPAHRLFREPGWLDTVVSLHSFSKELALPGYRVGAVVGSPELNQEIAKLLDCVAVCAPRIGQEAVLAGLRHAREWRIERSRDIASRRSWFRQVMAQRPGGFEALSCGGFFAWIRHPFADRPTAQVVRELAIRFDAIVMPGTAFLPCDHNMIRVSVGNCDRDAVDDLARRLEAFSRSIA